MFNITKKNSWFVSIVEHLSGLNSFLKKNQLFNICNF